MRFTPPLTAKLGDAAAESVRQNVDRRIGELQALPCVDIDVINGVTLPNGVDVWVRHRLGRAPKMVKVSPVYVPGSAVLSVGQIVERRGTTTTGATIDRTQAIVLFAGAFGATVHVDVEVT